LRVVDIELPPLKDRSGDVLLLAQHFLDAIGSGRFRLSPEVEGILCSYPWPGNVRELANDDGFRAAKARAIDSFELSILTAALRRHNGNVSRAALALGLHRQNMQQKLRRLGISAASFKQI
jgi:DNA-binding NtrC family response regulator